MTILSFYFPILFSLSLSFFLSFLLPTLLNFFKKNLHSFLGLLPSLPTDNLHLQCHHHVSSIAGGLGLITAARDLKAPPNVVESVTSEKSTPPSSPTIKRDPGGDGFIDDIGGGVDGLMSCTESLGFESSDERRVDDQTEEIKNSNMDENEDNTDVGEVGWRRMRTAEGRRNWRNDNCKIREVKSFPPPLSSLNSNGRPCFFLRPVRKDGRLELTEVRIHRPEILHASREDGRLRLHLIRDDSVLDEEEEVEEEEEEEEEGVEEEENVAQLEEEEIVEEEEGEEIEEKIRYEERKEEEKEKKDNGEEWKFAMRGSEGFRRCHEMVNHHHHRVHGSHHHLHMCGVSIV